MSKIMLIIITVLLFVLTMISSDELHMIFSTLFWIFFLIGAFKTAKDRKQKKEK